MCSAELKAFTFDHEKTTEVLLYIASNLPDDNATLYPALKILYLADRLHLSRYGRFISGDSYVAMIHGPVPSGAYDIVKAARGDGACADEHVLNSLSVDRVSGRISALRAPNLGLFSESDIECLDLTLKEHGNKKFPQMKEISHDDAYEKADINGFISLKDIVNSLPENSEDLLDHLSDRYPG